MCDASNNVPTVIRRVVPCACDFHADQRPYIRFAVLFETHLQVLNRAGLVAYVLVCNPRNGGGMTHTHNQSELLIARPTNISVAM